MDGFSPPEDPSLNLMLSLSTKIFDAEDIKDIMPEEYVKNLNKFLSTIDESWIEHCCINLKTSASARTECSHRLVLLSSLHTLFEHSCQGNSSLDHVDCKKGEESSSPPRSSDFENTDLRASSIYLSSDLIGLKSDQNCNRNKEDQHKHGECDDAFRWYKKTAALLLEGNVVIDSMLQLFQSACTFTQHLAKKVIISCVIYCQNKVTIILQHIESMLSHDFDRNIKMFDLLKEFMSICDLQQKSAINKETYEWFTNHFESKHMLSLAKVTSSCIKRKTDGNSNFISFLSFIKKIIKYGNYHRDRIKPLYLPLLTDFLIKDTSKNMLEEGRIHQPVILKIVKILNLALSLDILLEKGTISMPMTKLAMQIVQKFPSLFVSLNRNYLSMNKSFWGTVKSDAVRTDKDIHSVCTNYSMARQFLVLSFKSCLFSSLSEPSDDVEIKVCAYQIYGKFQTWFLEQKSGANESDWFPALLGEEDDQWITVLLCLLLIYIYLEKKQENAQSSSANMYSSQSVESDSSSQHEHTYIKYERVPDSFTDRSSPPSSHVEQTKISCFDDPLSPHKLFLQFANFIAFDHLVIADFLLSPETYFLAYFTKYISLLNDEWKVFFNSCHLKETFPTEKDLFHLNIESVSAHPCPNDNSMVTVDNSQSECYSLIPESSSYNLSPSVPSKHLKIQPTSCSGSDRKSDTAIEPADKRMWFKRSPETEQCLMKSSDVSVTALKTGSKRKLTNISLLVSYTDSEDSENETSDNEDIDFDKSGNDILRPQYNRSSEVPEIKKEKDGDASENKTTKNYLTIPAYSSFQGRSHSDYTSVSHFNKSSDDEDSEQDSNEDAEKDFEPKNCLLDQFMTMLIRLQLHIDRLNERHLIPYNVNPLLHLLNLCIEKYECDETESEIL